MKRVLFTLLMIAISSELFCQGIAGAPVEKTFPFSSKSVTLTSSWIKHREDLNTEYLKMLDPDRLLHNFRINAGLPSSAQPLEGWEAPFIGLRGHFVGHYLDYSPNGQLISTKCFDDNGQLIK